MNTLIKRLLALTACALPILAQTSLAQEKTCADDCVYKNLPFDMPKVERPVFPDYSVNILQFGAKGNGIELNTKAINDAIKAVNAKGGGTVVIPEGLWLTGPIELLSNVNLHAEKNALIIFTDDFNAYPIIKTSFEGLEGRGVKTVKGISLTLDGASFFALTYPRFITGFQRENTSCSRKY